MTLSQTAVLVKKIITISLIMLFLGTSSFIGYKLWHAYYIAHLPPVVEKPDTKFGLLPIPDFPTSSVSSSNYSYSLDTSTGSLPKIGVDPGFDKIIKVYFITKSFSTLLSPEKSQNLAAKFNINTNPQILSDTKYQFTDQSKTLTVDLDTGNFLYRKEATVSGKETLNDDDKLVSGFEKTLDSLGIPISDLTKGRTKITLLKSNGNTLVPTNLRAEAQAAQISLWPQNIDQKSIFTSDFNKALVNATIVKSATDLADYISIQFTDYPIDTTTFATYPLKSPEVAYADLKSGKGVVVLEPTKPQVSVSSVYLGYYLSDNYNPYLEPIYVFEGQDFVAYVPAVSDEFITQTR